MAQYVTKIRTENGDMQIDYNALGNLPKFDTTLTESGYIADAKSVGDQIKVISESVNQLAEDVTNIADNLTPQAIGAAATINGVSPDENGNIQLTADDIGAAPDGYGLGKSKAITWDEIDKTTAPGWYHIDGEHSIDDPMGELNGITATYWYMHVSAYDDGKLHCTQTLYPVGKTYGVYRTCNDGVFADWERSVYTRELADIQANLSNHTHDYLPLSGGTLTGNVTLEKSTGSAIISVKNGDNKINFEISDAKNKGIYDSTNKKWLIYSNEDDLAKVDDDQTVEVPCLRNIYAGTAELKSKSSKLDTGVIYLQFE